MGSALSRVRSVAAYDLDTGEQRTLCRINSAVFHVTAYDNEHFVVTHPAKGPGMMLTDMSTGRCELIRDGVVHCPCTQRGIAYEVPPERLLGWMDPLSQRFIEFPMPEQFQYIHTGRDPEGRLFIYENSVGLGSFRRPRHVRRSCISTSRRTRVNGCG